MFLKKIKKFNFLKICFNYEFTEFEPWTQH